MAEQLSDSNSEDKAFNDKKRLFFLKLGIKHKDLIAIHKIAGQVSRDPQFGQDEMGRDKRWGDPTQHCLVEAAGSQILGNIIGLSEADKALLERAAVAHDARKKGEIEEGRGVTSAETIEEMYARSKQFLLDHDVDPDVVELTEAVAHTSLPEFATLDPVTNEIALKDNIMSVRLAMHYIDDITHGTHFVPLNERMDGLVERQHLYPYNEDGKNIWGGRTFFEAQGEVGKLVEAKLGALAGIEDPTTLPSLIEQGVQAQISGVDLGTQAA